MTFNPAWHVFMIQPNGLNREMAVARCSCGWGMGFPSDTIPEDDALLIAAMQHQREYEDMEKELGEKEATFQVPEEGKLRVAGTRDTCTCPGGQEVETTKGEGIGIKRCESCRGWRPFAFQVKVSMWERWVQKLRGAMKR